MSSSLGFVCDFTKKKKKTLNFVLIGCEDVLDLIRHIMLHGYHSLLKSIGEIEQNKLNLTECNIEIDDEYHVLSTVNIPFHCDWLQCCEQFVCPNNYYRHVENHILEDLLDENGELQKPAQTKMACRWKGKKSQYPSSFGSSVLHRLFYSG